MSKPHSAAAVLEWGRLVELCKLEAKSELAKAETEKLNWPERWAPDLAAAKHLQQETLELLPLLDKDALWGPLQELGDPSDVLEQLAKGAVLEIPALVLLRRWMYAMDSWAQLPRDEVRGELLRKAISNLSDPHEPLRIIERIITPQGELAENASPKLYSLFSEIRGLKREIEATLDRVLKDLTLKNVLQSNYSDVHDGRFVLPVKSSNQHDVEGVVYGGSASKQTVFIEPKEVAPFNNRLHQRQNELAQEIYVVLQETAKKLFPYGPELSMNAQILAHWDAVQARARLGRRYSGKPIRVTEDRKFELHATAHPLLWWALPPDTIVRNDLEMAEPTQTLLLTGPNTGGKTVLLKTLGLAGICARTGFLFPASEPAEVPFFDSFFADLGDSQSIEQHLSTFSGHILRFREILENVTSRSLVLMDELSSSTDPEEGSALSRAFLETVMARGALIVATTHDPKLKIQSTKSQIVCASMAFDEASRTPTFKLILGIPGRSRALETAQRLGLPQAVVDLAKSYLSKEHNQFEGLLARFESDLHGAEKARKEAFALRDEADRLRKEWLEKTSVNVSEMMEKTRQKLKRIQEQAQDEVRTALRVLEERKNELKSRKDIDQVRASVNDTFRATFQAASSLAEKALGEEAPELAKTLKEIAPAPLLNTPAAPEKPELKAGTNVRVPKWKSIGKVLELIAPGKVKVALGSIQVILPIEDIDPLAASAPEAKALKAAERKRSQVSDVAVPPSQIDLRGERFEEAMSKLESYLDQAFRSSALKEVIIIHGLGTGSLREGTRKLLGELPYIKTFRDAGAGQGGTGATLVEFDLD